MLQYVSVGIFGGVDPDGKGTEPFPESDEDFRGMRQADVLSDQ